MKKAHKALLASFAAVVFGSVSVSVGWHLATDFYRSQIAVDIFGFPLRVECPVCDERARGRDAAAVDGDHWMRPYRCNSCSHQWEEFVPR